MGEAVECEELSHEKFDVAGQLKAFIEVGGEILACGTCLKQKDGRVRCLFYIYYDRLRSNGGMGGQDRHVLTGWWAL